jgi:hypothetical protein
MADVFIINVTVGANSVTVDSDSVEADYHDQIKWSSTNASRFHIQFENNKTPFDRMNLTYAEATTFRNPEEAAAVGNYKYTIVSDANPNVTKDPYIKIKNPTIQT